MWGVHFYTIEQQAPMESATFTRTPALKAAFDRMKQGIKGRLDGHYQHEGVKWMLHRELEPTVGKGGILADDMGLGKTMQAIAAMRGNPMTTLIVSLVGTVGQWRDALIEFGGYRPIIVNPSFCGDLPSDTEVAITTYSVFQQPRGPASCFSTMKWGRIILDEGHTIRNPTTKVYKEVSKLVAGVRWVLSGTPIQNSSKDLLSLAKWIGSPTQDIDEIVRMMVLRRTHEQQAQANPRLALPPLETLVVKLKFGTKEEEDFYKGVEKYYTSQTKTKTDAMEALIRCRQAANHPKLYQEGMARKRSQKRRRIDDDDDEPPALPPTGCQSKLNHIVKEIRGVSDKVLIFCTWTTEMKLIQAALKEVGVISLIYDGKISRDNKEAVIYNFKNTNIQVLLLQINCGSTGLNLQCASRVYITSPHWNPCIELQAIGRVYRKGQTQKVLCFRLVMEGTIEDKCSVVQRGKVDLISEAMSDDTFSYRLGNQETPASSPMYSDEYDFADLEDF